MHQRRLRQPNRSQKKGKAQKRTWKNKFWKCSANKSAMQERKLAQNQTVLRLPNFNAGN